MNTSISKFLKYTTSKWDRDIPLKNIWTVHFLGLRGVVRGISNILYNSERFLNRDIWPVADYASEQDPVHGLYAAQNVKLPSDSYNVVGSSIPNMNGLRLATVADSRKPYDLFTIDFIETNTDILDYLFRPWVLAASHKGYIEDGDPNTIIKSDVVVELYSRLNPKDISPNPNEWTVRKTFLFEGVVPVTIAGDDLNYNQIQLNDITKQVGFSFKNYHIVRNPRTRDVVGVPLFTETSKGNIAASIANDVNITGDSNITNGSLNLNS